jgi:uncharacterized protein (DUF1015 family)
LEIIPFRAVRPTRDKVSLVTARSYDDYTPAELAAQLEFNPLSFLHVLSPAYTESQKTSAERRFRLVHQRYQSFKQDRIMVQDPQPAFYLHQIAGNGHTFNGIIAAASVADIKRNVIRKHEDTLEYRVKLFKDYLGVSGFNTEPVLIAYPSNAEISQWIGQATQREPDFEFSTTRHQVHCLWKIDAEDDIRLVQEAFGKIPAAYIADGHHRSASAEMLCDDQAYSTDAKKHFMAFLIAEDNVVIYPYNRLIRDLNGLDRTSFLQRISEDFVVSSKGSQWRLPARKHEWGMYLGGTYYTLELKEGPDDSSPLEGLDAQILFERILKPVLGIEDLRNDDRIDYVSGKLPAQTLGLRVDDGEFELAFFLYPADMPQICAIADAGQVMPPKSTYIEPKFRSGLLVYEIG